jgi:adenylate kinase
VPHVSTGDMFRAAIAAQSELGKQVEPLLAQGTLVPDEITIPLIREELLKTGGGGFILDGYPRTIVQAEALDALLDEIGEPLSIVLLLALDDDIARERLLRRAAEEGRADDRPGAIDERLATYHRQTAPVVDHYRTSGNLVQLHAERPVNEVWAEISDALSQVEARA